jgi:hypothetical protein
MTTSLIIDCETLDTSPNSVITEIGIIAVNRADFVAFDELRVVPELFYQLLKGRTLSADTVAFHRKHGTLPDSTRGLTPIACTVAITEFIQRHSPKRVWIQGTCFDRPLIESFFRGEGQPLPWNFGISRDARSIWDAAYPDIKHPPRPHRAIADCRATLADLHAALATLGRLAAF